jgi:hypothetical protein
MLRKLNLERMTAVAAAVAAAGLLMPAPAQAQVWYSEVCIQYYRDYCAANWQRQGFASSAQCADWYKENACRGTTIYEEYSSVSSANRRG